MTDERTAAQVAADTALDDAIALHNDAYALPESEMKSSIVTEYVVVYASRGFNDEGDDIFRNVTHPSRSATPHGALGLIQAAWLDAQSGHYGWGDE